MFHKTFLESASHFEIFLLSIPRAVLSVYFKKFLIVMNVHEFTKKVYVGDKVGDIPSW